MKKGRFLWSAHRITEKQKAGKARNIKEKQLKNSRNTVLKQLVELLSSQKDKCIFAIINPKVAYGFGDFFTFGSSELQNQINKIPIMLKILLDDRICFTVCRTDFTIVSIGGQ